MARRIGKYKVSTRIWDINQQDDANNTPATLAVGGGYGSTGCSVAGNGNVQSNGTLTIDGISTLTGEVSATAGVVCGTDGSAQGKLTLWDGGGGNTPAYILMHSPNGTANYLFFEDDGTLKRHTSAPTANANGDEIGAQT